MPTGPTPAAFPLRPLILPLGVTSQSSPTVAIPIRAATGRGAVQPSFRRRQRGRAHRGARHARPAPRLAVARAGAASARRLVAGPKLRFPQGSQGACSPGCARALQICCAGALEQLARLLVADVAASLATASSDSALATIANVLAVGAPRRRWDSGSPRPRRRWDSGSPRPHRRWDSGSPRPRLRWDSGSPWPRRR
jgi:hypothetical protein